MKWNSLNFCLFLNCLWHSEYDQFIKLALDRHFCISFRPLKWNIVSNCDLPSERTNYKLTVVRLEKKPGIVANFKSFKFTDVLLEHSSSCLRLIIVYRPQTMADSTSSTTKFFEEFPGLLESLLTVPSSLLMVGDFNFRVNDASDRSAQRFLHLLEAFNLKQHLWVPTHGSGNTFLFKYCKKVATNQFISHLRDN